MLTGVVALYIIAGTSISETSWFDGSLYYSTFSFLLQMLTGIVVLYIAKLIQAVEFPDFSTDIFRKVSCYMLFTLF